MKFNFLKVAFLVVAFAVTPVSLMAMETDLDPRIKTLVYNENEVYSFVTRSGFQSSIEFSRDENIETLSIGDSIGWQVTPAVNRIFIKPLQRNGITNLAVITNKRSYQFELLATDSRNNHSTSHVYVLRFFYPDENGYKADPTDRTRGDLRPISNTPIPELPASFAPAPAPSAPVSLPEDFSAPPLSAPPPPAAIPAAFNYNYTLTGPDSLAPTKVYDDGKSTYLELPPSALAPTVSIVSPVGSEIPVPAKRQGNMLVVNQVVDKLTIRNGNDLVCLFNEQAISFSPQMGAR